MQRSVTANQFQILESKMYGTNWKLLSLISKENNIYMSVNLPWDYSL